MVYAIVETGGKQVLVQPGRFYDVELLALDVEAALTFDKVLLVRHEGGAVVGRPTVEGAAVQGRILQHGKAAKVTVYKMRPKKGYRRKKGHRQRFTRVMIESIDFEGRSFTAEAKAEAVSST
ncbi:50S ribosomal protein L21 [Gloeobacter violaceus]|uniref:Large ribosomal subunit protein bL21 n=1 Tax=Gloeobacter violaceus (strain ATCC 29082 / PCC 7421) TaxID=251221 RepID=RL21_GLOVI|nr:50S ribosomal protein L21 [Gloeobacter violaceus]Q7NME1.1 RecName: Full=Large ribosomal subunit protein bL21; AltName: Full=50S ribosomal protein L21 [Gloeobacter violaceus PCC 7421]BAC88766.1 50S ribosomal protein L21 [Gloeobacter violaceus PCC 7421]